MFYNLFTQHKIPYFVLIVGLSFFKINCAESKKKLGVCKSYNCNTEYDSAVLKDITLHIIEKFPQFICYIPALLTRVTQVSERNEKFLKIEHFIIPEDLKSFLTAKRKMFCNRYYSRIARLKHTGHLVPVLDQATKESLKLEVDRGAEDQLSIDIIKNG